MLWPWKPSWCPHILQKKELSESNQIFQAMITIVMPGKGQLFHLLQITQ
jgi:hypothetical protein